uniref:Phosphoinositide phospholipase C n=1 Tax=Chenopodium quinoa TaxID=63459 RepID=A0A803LXE0_CHEQI
MNTMKKLFTPTADQLNKPKQSYKFCFCFRRMFKLRMAEPPTDIKNLFDEYSDKGAMTVEKLHQFLNDYQGEHHTIESAQDIFNSIKHHHVFLRRSLNLDAFFQYLSGDLNPPLAHPRVVHQNMNEPLAHYFLYTGHNSYLTGNQLSSKSSIKPIIKALLSGVRVIELDLWPSKNNKNDIEVFHGGTMTSPVKLHKCLQAIKENAFVASKYPVIITFEDHLTSFLQAKMVSDIFGAMLYPGLEFVAFPSPEQLKEKILISTKPPKISLDSIIQQEHNDELEDITIKDNEEECEEDTAVPEYMHLIAIHAVKLKHGDDDGLKKLLNEHTQRVARLSMSEEKLINAVKTYASDIVKFTQRNLLRIYPKGTRFFSSNYDPFIGWTHGAQMVAFNMQGYGKYLWIMQGMFRANGNCGYVRKPDFLLSDEPFNPNIIERPLKMILKIKLYMGYGWHLEFRRTHFDPFSPPDFFTKVAICGVPADIKKDKTRPIEDQWVPMWNKEFEFPLTAPELALLRIEVREHDLDGRHAFGGQTCLPVLELQSGIRAVPLFGKKGQKYDHIKLLMRFQLLPI